MKIKRVIELEEDTLKRIDEAKSVPDMFGTDIVNGLNAIRNGTPYDEAEVWRKSNELLKKRLTYLQAVETRPKDEWIEFADYVARNVVSEDFSEDVDFYAEVLCRKLVKLGLVKLDGDIYKYCGADMRKGGAE